jgi:hypothetical protein
VGPLVHRCCSAYHGGQRRLGEDMGEGLQHIMRPLQHLGKGYRHGRRPRTVSSPSTRLRGAPKRAPCWRMPCLKPNSIPSGLPGRPGDSRLTLPPSLPACCAGLLTPWRTRNLALGSCGSCAGPTSFLGTIADLRVHFFGFVLFFSQ